jgi:ubiquinone/menaquinone biosynthesis C-methylase UbiE
MSIAALDPPMTVRELYFYRMAAAFVRAHILQDGCNRWEDRLCTEPLKSLTVGDMEMLLEQGRARGLNLQRFKRTMREPRLQRIFCALNQIAPRNLLDVGTGRGDVLWPLLEEFPRVSVTATDRDSQSVADVRAVQAGGYERLAGFQMDAAALEFGDRTFDVVTLLDVLPELADPDQALAEAVRVSRHFVIVSIPSFGMGAADCIKGAEQESLRHLLSRAGCRRVSVSPVFGHLIGVASVERG